MTQPTIEKTEFIYLLNAFEQASQAAEPFAAGYADKRVALVNFVRDLEAENARYVGLAADLWNIQNVVENAATEIGDLRRALSHKREE